MQQHTEGVVAFSYYCVTNSNLISRILRNFGYVALGLAFAAMNVGNISHHTFSMDAIYCINGGFLKTNAHWALYWNKKAIYNNQ